MIRFSSETLALHHRGRARAITSHLLCLFWLLCSSRFVEHDAYESKEQHDRLELDSSLSSKQRDIWSSGAFYLYAVRSLGRKTMMWVRESYTLKRVVCDTTCKKDREERTNVPQQCFRLPTSTQDASPAPSYLRRVCNERRGRRTWAEPPQSIYRCLWKFLREICRLQQSVEDSEDQRTCRATPWGWSWRNTRTYHTVTRSQRGTVYQSLQKDQHRVLLKTSTTKRLTIEKN